MATRGGALVRMGAVALGWLVGCAKPAPIVVTSPWPVTPAEPAVPTDAPPLEPLEADFEAPTLSDATLEAWNDYGQAYCRRSEPVRAAEKCRAYGQAEPCRQRDFEGMLGSCAGAESCLDVAEQIEDCRTCFWRNRDDPDRYDRLAKERQRRLAQLGNDCAGALRHLEGAEYGDEARVWLHAMKGPEAVACLSKSAHPRATELLAFWSESKKPNPLLDADPERVRKWIAAVLADMVSDAPHAAWETHTMWAFVDRLGPHARPVLPALIRVATHEYVDPGARRYLSDRAIAALGHVGDASTVDVLRRLLRDDHDWRRQEAAIRALAALGHVAVGSASDLQTVVSGHPWPPLRALADQAIRSVTSQDDPTTEELDDGEVWPEERWIPVYADHISGAYPSERRDHHADVDGRTVVPGRLRTQRATLPLPLKDLDLERQVRWRQAGVVDLTALTSARRWEGGWLLGMNKGEWGGALWWVNRRGRGRPLLRTNVLAIIELGDDLYALTGLAHMGARLGALLRIRATRRGPIVEHAFSLPLAPQWWEAHDEGLYVDTPFGLLVVRPDLDAELVPWTEDRSLPGTVPRDAVQGYVEHHRHRIDRCLEPLRPVAHECHGHTPMVGVDVRFVVAEDGRVDQIVAAHPEDSIFSDWPATPEVLACLQTALRPWRFAPPTEGAATFGYVFEP